MAAPVDAFCQASWSDSVKLIKDALTWFSTSSASPCPLPRCLLTQALARPVVGFFFFFFFLKELEEGFFWGGGA